ncbi:MAG: GDP-L-fucose synthase [Candidatus Electronema aureum]|uniref:GDP-L-fucose synthase n=1 Tax=Candidatus Electronema aureum TaxID=2005002 RepID=A0A521G417_9BACT|nr:MAG: GDP-L-fucose synthase [Candidatus Electronema aureum]
MALSLAPSSSIYVAGHRGLVGSAICRALAQAGCTNLLTRTHVELDLTDQAAVRRFFDEARPDFVFLAAAKVGGIHANNSSPADFIRDNLLIQTNIIDAAWRNRVKKLLFLGSSCIYPKFSPQPMKEEHLLSGALEPTNEWYAIAKIAGIKMCQAYRKQHGFDAISLMPTNLYGSGDNFDLHSSHVLPALIRKFHEAKINKLPEVEIWGTGTPKREFLHVDDLASACLFLMDHYSSTEIINVGSGQEVTIADLATLVSEAVGFRGELRYNTTMPDGTPRKLLDVSKLSALGWKSQIVLRDGIADTYSWFLENALVARR